MPIYAAAAAGAVILCTMLILFVFGRLKLLNTLTLVSVALAALLTVAAFPFVYDLLSQWLNGGSDPKPLLPVIALALAGCLALAFLLSVLLSIVFRGFIKAPAQTAAELSEAGDQTAAAENDNYLEKIYEKLVQEKNGETPKNEENGDHAENNLEKSVDSSENIDKMGIENIVQNSTVMTIDECIAEAFTRKETGDLEGAVQHFIEALDRNPHRELAFWIVLDICVLYKDLGQVDLAYDILNGYHEAFGDMMDASVKTEIENNLFDIQA
jgi:tetratricopeptide (TPR) repeat protein